MNKRSLFPSLAAFALVLLTSARPAFSTEGEKKPDAFWQDNFFITGELSQETAYRLSSPRNFSKIKEQITLDMKFIFNDHAKLKIGGRAYLDGAYDLTSFYPKPVKDNMRKEIALRDAYLDLTFPSINMRLGHQQIVWGEALGQFFADVVTPKDLREFFLPSFDQVRLPIWAIDAQFNFLPDSTLEAVISPDQTVDKLALPGADFAFQVPPIPGTTTVLLPDKRPDTDFKHWNAGARIATLIHGWDLSWFYYTSPDHVPTLSKTLTADPITASPILALEPIHGRVHHFATTFSKAFGSAVARGEFVYTRNRFFNTSTPTLNSGIARTGQFRYVLGFDYDVLGHLMINGEFQQEIIAGSSTGITDQSLRSWVFLRLQSSLLDSHLTPQLVFIVGLDGGDTLISPKLSYTVANSVTLNWGADIFSGPQDQLYGQFDRKDRIYMNTQWRF